MANPQQRCVFCNGTGLSKEHVWSEWTYALIPKMRDGSHVRGLITGIPGKPKKLEVFKGYQGSVNTIKIRVICKRCNNGWMSALENQVKPILTPLVQGEKCELDETAQQILARWIAAKIVVSEHARRDLAATSRGDRSAIMIGELNPGRWQMWIGAHCCRSWFQGGYNRQAVTLGSINPATGHPEPPNNSFAKNTQAVTFGLGKLLIYVLYSSVEDLGELKFTGILGERLNRITPIQGRIAWSCDAILDDLQIEQVTTAFDRFSASLKWRDAP